MTVNRSSLFGFLLLGVLLVTLPLTVFLSQQQQKIEQHAATNSIAGTMSAPPGYSKLFFDDTFTGTILNSSKWIPQMSDPGGIWCGQGGINCPNSFVGYPPGHYNAEYGNPDEVVVNNGLTLNAKRDTTFSGYTWKAGYITTYNKFTFNQGYFQVRAKMPDSTTGAWAGIWFLQKGSAGEIDLQESGYTGCGSNFVNQCLAVNLHTSGNNQKIFNTGVDLSSSYHIYGMEYQPGKSITMYFDGKQIIQYTSNIPTGAYNIILTETIAQNASDWHTLVSSSTLSPLSPYQVSEVQVWQQCSLNCANPSATPTPTTLPSPTQGITSSPTNPQPATTFSLTMCPHGLGNCGDNANQHSGGNISPLHPQRTVAVSVYDASNNLVVIKQGIVSYNNSAGNFQGIIDMGTLVSGSYFVKVKADGFLQKQLPGIQQISTKQTNTLPLVSLVAGDINNDNQIDIQDYNILISCFGSKQQTSACIAQPSATSAGADINDDGMVNGIDYNLFLRELSVQHGDGVNPTLTPTPTIAGQ